MPPGQPVGRRGFPLSVVLVLAAAGLLTAGALVSLGLWFQTFGSEQGWWELPTDDEPGVALVFGCVLAALAGLVIWAAARRCRRVFGYSRLATALIVGGVLVGVVVLVVAYSI